MFLKNDEEYKEAVERQKELQFIKQTIGLDAVQDEELYDLESSIYFYRETI